MKLTICSRSIIRGNVYVQWAIHAEDCADIARTEVPRCGAHLETKDFATTDEAVAYVLDEEVKEMGYTTDHVRVFPCCKG